MRVSRSSVLAACLRVLCAAWISALPCCKKPEGGSNPPAGQQGQRLFAVSFMTLNNPFFVDLNEGIKKVVESHGDRLVTLDGQHSSLKQRNDLSDMLHQDP